jgi:hypothetical protein
MALRIDFNQSAAPVGLLEYLKEGWVCGGLMRVPTERDECQAMLDILVGGFMGGDGDAYREASAWLRDFIDQKNTERGRVMCGDNWFAPQTIESMRQRARKREQQRRLKQQRMMP